MNEQQLFREARRVLRKLGGNARLVAIDRRRFMVTGTRARRGAIRIERETVEALFDRGWLYGSVRDGFALSEAGRGWLLRAESTRGSPYLAQHRLMSRRLVMDPQGMEREVDVNDAESPLAWLRRRKLIDTMQFEAGERLRRDFTLAQLQPRLGIDLQAPTVMGGNRAPGEFSEMVLTAKQRFAAAMRAVGPGLSDILFDVCCHLMRLEGIERELGWPKRSAKVVLLIALDRLGAHYGMSLTAPSQAKMRSWTAGAA
jgi:hypothetical protein